MTGAALKAEEKHGQKHLIIPVAIAMLLALLCITLYHSALSGGWRFDDGPHLNFTALYSPWQYFFVPEIMREQSWANFTPWNPFFYEIGLPFFGLNATGHYVHLLTVLWLTALSTFFLLRLWLGILASFMGAMVFLAMPTTGAISQMLMTGHYAYGLLFTVLSLLFFTRSIREKSTLFCFISAGLYLCACWSKELYVPLIGILILLPEGHWKIRLRYALPSIVVALIYVGYRMAVFRGVGGYGVQVQNGPFEFTNVLHLFTVNLFGNLAIGSLIAIFICVAATTSIMLQKKKIPPGFFAVALVSVFFPILIMMIFGDIGNALNTRVLFLIGWSLAIILAWLTHGSTIYAILLVPLAVLLMHSQQNKIAEVINAEAPMEAENRFMIEGAEDEILLSMQFARLGYLSDMRNAAIQLGNSRPPTFPTSEEEIANLGAAIGSKSYQYNNECRCIQQTGVENYKSRVEDFRFRLDKGANQSLDVFLEIIDLGFRKLLRWKFYGPEGHYLLYVKNHTVIPLPSSGEMTFAATGLLKQKQEIQVYVHVITPDGAIVRSPVLAINPSINNQISWSGKSAVVWEYESSSPSILTGSAF
jgi:hypothetical protein